MNISLSAVILILGDIMIELVEIKKCELLKAYRFHFKGFIHTFMKYRDKTNPIFMPFGKLKKYYNNPDMSMFWIIDNEAKVGQIWIASNNEIVKLARLFVLKKYQNKGIAQAAIKIAEKIYSDRQQWCLDTIKQEKNNCHLYEKLGYKATGEEHIVNKRMTIINYEKEIK